ncbi:MAG: DUF2723 domain-containing protein [Chloroflexi bacterium]|nr:DUF2723 domain-containing protein [Chloroflexota bacterium]
MLVGVALWAASLALYFLTLAPTLTWGAGNIGVDGGELLAAADTLGVPHPPGYPTYTLLLKLFGTIVPVGDFAYRGNLMSAVLASASVVMVYLVILRLCRYLKPDSAKPLWTVSAALGASVFAVSPLFWSQAIITEVYTLNTLFVGALLLIATHLALRPPQEQARDERLTLKMALFGFLLGLGLGNHLTLLAIAVPLIFWLWATLGWRKLASPWTIGALVLGLAIYVYLPIRAAQNPPVNWGGADTLGGMAWMLSGQAYRDYVFGVPFGAIPERILGWADLVFTQLNPLGIFIGLVGASALYNRARWLFAAMLGAMAILSIYSINYNTVDFQVLMIPAVMLFSVWIGIGFISILSAVSTWAQDSLGAERSLKLPGVRLAAARPILLLSVIGFGALPFSSLLLNYESQNLSDDRRAYDYAREIIDAVPDGSIVFSSDEASVFSLWYMRYVEEKERDVAPIAGPLLQFDWYWRSIHETYPDRFPAEGPSDFSQAINRIVELNYESSRIFFTYPDRFLNDSFELERVGKLYEVRLKTSQ